MVKSHTKSVHITLLHHYTINYLVVTDEPLKSLQKAGLNSTLFDDVVAGPPESVVLAATEVAHDVQVFRWVSLVEFFSFLLTFFHPVTIVHSSSGAGGF